MEFNSANYIKVLLQFKIIINMYNRNLTEKLRYVATKFPVVTLTGPRQSGKTTLVQNIFPDKKYVTLEDYDNRTFATEDPRGFLNFYRGGVIIDEAQYVPALFSYIQTHVDKSKIMGEFILTGSQHFLLTERITQSLAGRAAILELLPCTLDELSLSNESIYDVLWKGFYPGIHSQEIDPNIFYKSYLNTYVERDLRSLSSLHDLSKFRTFLQLAAGRVGQLVNMTLLGNDCGIDQKTVKAWFALLETSYIAFFLKPHHQNFNKRLSKQPKLYFYDTGLVSYLLSIERPTDIRRHFARGALFENYVAIELLKKRFNEGKESDIYFWRDSHGSEVDFIKDLGSELIPIEVKSSETLDISLFKGLKYWQRLSGVNKGYLIYGGSEMQERSNFTVLPWYDVAQI